jgi:CRISPR-associated protein Cas5a/b/c
MLALMVEGVFHWGFSVRLVTESAGAQYYPYPPPSTLIGALAYGVSVVKELPECVVTTAGGGGAGILSTAAQVHRAVRWAAFAFSDEFSVGHAVAVGYSDFIRAFRLPYQRGTRHTWDQSDMWYGVNAHGRVYACGAGFKAIYLADEKGLEELGLGEHDLLGAAYSIVRVGVRESLVSVVSAEVTRDVGIRKAGEVKGPLEIEYYFPARLAEDVEHAELVHLPKLDPRLWEFRPTSPILLHDHEEFYAPPGIGFVLKPGRMLVGRLAEGAALVSARFEGRVERVVAPAEVVRR